MFGLNLKTSTGEKMTDLKVQVAQVCKPCKSIPDYISQPF